MVTIALLAVPFASLGIRVLASVLLYNLALPLAARALGHPHWFSLWLFLVPLSALQIVPDWVLSAKLDVLVFPDIGGPRLDTVTLAMAGMWTIALFPVVFGGQRVKARWGRRAALATVAAASFVIFIGSEAWAWRLPIWHAQNVGMIQGVAYYVIIPEIVLGLATFRTFEATSEKSLAVRLASAVALMLLYLGLLLVFYRLIEDAFLS